MAKSKRKARKYQVQPAEVRAVEPDEAPAARIAATVRAPSAVTRAQSGAPRDDLPADGPDLGILLAIAYRCAIDQLTARLTAAGFPGIRPADGYMFRALRGDGHTSTELAQILGISKQATIKIVDHMEGRSLVARHPVADDRRAKIIRLTDQGRHTMETAIRVNGEIEAEFAAQVGAEDVSAMRAALIAFTEAYGGAEDARARRARPVW
jgi:DNA-binding MarR family transcriptional regulator